MKKLLILATFMFINTLASANTWTNAVYVEEISIFLADNNGSWQIHLKSESQLTHEDGSPFAASCALTRDERTVTTYTPSSLHIEDSIMYSALLNAYNLGHRVKLRIWDTRCNSSQANKLVGVKVI